MECEAFVRFKATKDGEYLTVKAINLQHNHPANAVSDHVTLPEGSICNHILKQVVKLYLCISIKHNKMLRFKNGLIAQN